MKVALMTHAGGAHLSAYLSALAVADDCDEVVLADPDERWKASAEKALGGKLTRTYTSYAKLLKEESPKFCLISMEAVLAPPVIEAALEAGAHVFSEKPGCTSIEQFEKLANLAESKHLQLMLAFANRVNPESLAARRMIRQKRIGSVYSIDMHIVADQTRLTRESYHQSWFADRQRSGGGHLIWLGIHWLDLAMYLTDSQIAEVTGMIANVGGQPINVEDSAVATLKFEDGIVGTINSGYYLDAGYHTQIRIWGSKGWLNLDSIGTPKLVWYESSGPKAKQIQSFDQATEPRGYTPFVTRAISAIAHDTPPPITTQESLNTLRTVFGIYAAAETRQAVKFTS
ncbi:Gfo/Idh/MocA family protein [Thalassoroseus pseudoceratinae]|uniref:Gfo/Idh/MocA family protein n=1 Tax=Thalassoroseus pseudoceratinae TaxID=2713176 RepID=UPI0014237F08|nr:Gfo/Idh/MocA family oxidoreductase [Thalassoroseus pseudoceratinae]